MHGSAGRPATPFADLASSCQKWRRVRSRVVFKAHVDDEGSVGWCPERTWAATLSPDKQFCYTPRLQAIHLILLNLHCSRSYVHAHTLSLRHKNMLFKYWWVFNLAIFFKIRQIAKLKISPKFPTIRYNNMVHNNKKWLLYHASRELI